MSAQTRGLGRGLDALIPPAPSGTAPQGGQEGTQVQAGVLTVPVTDIIPNPRQPRTSIPAEALSELAASIREHGMIQPLIVTRARPTGPARYQLIAGERRWRAAQMAGLEAVPVLVKEATSQQLLELALVENIQRADLGPLEEAAAFQALMTEFRLSQQDVAERVGKSRVAIANTVRLLNLPASLKALLSDGALTEGHARALLGLSSPEAMTQAAEQVVARDLTVRQTEELVRRLQTVIDARDVDPEEPAPLGDSDALLTRRLEASFRDALGTKVALTRGRKGGRLVIHFYSDEELQAIYEQIVGVGEP
jgi:ParB family chromosome partitioning protein